jgi:hypothetical protein
VPSLLLILFVVAVASILFFPDLDISSFAPGSTDIAERQGDQLPLFPGKGDVTSNPKEPALVEPELEAEPTSRSGLAADDPLILSIAKLRREFADNYEVE